MGLADLFRPKHKHSDVRVRSEAVRALGRDETAILAQIAKTDRDPAIRRIAIEKLDEADVLADIAAADAERALRDLAGTRAAELWSSVACSADADAASAALAGLIKLGEQRALVDAAAKAAVPAIRKRALTELRDPRALAELAKTALQHETRLEAVSRIDDPEVLRALATDATAKEIGLAAVEKIDEPELLESVAQKAKNKAVRQRARKIVTEMAEAERAAQPRVADEVKRRRAEKAQLVRRVEAVAESFDFGKLSDAVRAAEKEWAGLAADEDLDEKFAALSKKVWARKEVHDQQLAVRRVSQELPAAAAPDPAARAAEMASALEPAAPDPAREQEDAERRAQREAQRAEDEARRKAEAEARAARAKEDAERAKELVASFDALIGEMESLLEAKDARAIDRLIGQAARSFEQVSRVAGPERAALAARYEKARAALVIRSKDLREAEEWQRFSNVPKADALIKEAQALLEAEAGPDLGGKLKTLQARWKEVGAIPHQRSKALWDQFKATCDQIYAKVVERRTVDQQKFAESATVKERLIAEAEALADSTDWDATAQQLKALQAEWKASGHLPRKQGDELWKRFRAACDRFFERRKPHLDAAHAEQNTNLEAKQALCARVEAVVAGAPGDAGWGAAINEIKAAQREWKDIGFVPRADADAIYRRFRTACDALFAKRDAARDAEADARRGELDAIRAEIEAVIASAEPEAVQRALAVRRKLDELAGADDRRGPSVEMAGLVDRMIRHVVATQPEAVRGTPLDPSALIAKRKKLIERAEALLEQGASPAADAATGEDLAERLKSAMRANAFAGLRFSGRDPVEVIDELRTEWAAAGPAIGDEAAALDDRFRDVMAKASAELGADRAPATRDALDRDSRSDNRGERRQRRRERSAEQRIETARAIESTPAQEPAAVAAAVTAAVSVEPASAAPVAVPAPVPVAVAVAEPVPVPAALSPAHPEQANTAHPEQAFAEGERASKDEGERASRDAVEAAPEPTLRPLSEREPLPPPPAPAPEPEPPAAEVAPPLPRRKSITEAPPMDDLDNAWDDEPLPGPPPAPPEPAPPGAGELAGDGGEDTDHLDVD